MAADRFPETRRSGVKIFVDFWNVVINARQQTSSYLPIDIKWNALARRIVNEASSSERGNDLAGCYIFGSYSQSNGQEQKFKNKVIDEYGAVGGLFFNFSERISKTTGVKCDNCGEAISRSSESGVDIALTVEMIKHANMHDHDYLALVSGDRDFLPLLDYLKDQGQRVLHISPGPPHREMRTSSWKQIPLKHHYASITQIRNEKGILLTLGQNTPMTQEIIEALNVEGLEFDVIDLSQPRSVPEADLRFLFNNLKIDVARKDIFGWVPNIRTSPLDAIAELARQDKLVGDFPKLILDGKAIAYRDRHNRWLVEASPWASALSKITTR